MSAFNPIVNVIVNTIGKTLNNDLTYLLLKLSRQERLNILSIGKVISLYNQHSDKRMLQIIMDKYGKLVIDININEYKEAKKVLRSDPDILEKIKHFLDSFYHKEISIIYDSFTDIEQKNIVKILWFLLYHEHTEQVNDLDKNLLDSYYSLIKETEKINQLLDT